MRSRVVLGLVVGLGLTAAPAWAQDAEQLRRDLEQIKKQFETMKDGYQKAIESLQKRIESLESRPPAPVVAPAPAPGGPAVGQAPPAAPPASERPSLMDLARPRRALRAVSPARPRPAPLRRRRGRRLRGRLHVERGGVVRHVHVPGRVQPVLSARGRDCLLRAGGPVRQWRRDPGGRRGIRRGRALVQFPAGRGLPESAHAPLRHPGQARQDAQPLRDPQRGPRARLSPDGPARRAHAVLRGGGTERVGPGAHLGRPAPLLPAAPRGRLQRAERSRLRLGQLSLPAGDRPRAHVLRS